MAIAGGCRCGAVRYRIEAEVVPPVYACHCTRCQTATGSAFALQMPVRLDEFAVEGEVTHVELATSSGSRSKHHYCPACMTRLYSLGTAYPGRAIVRAGTLDDTSGLNPAVHVHTSTRQPWVVLSRDVPAYPDDPGMEAWTRLFA